MAAALVTAAALTMPQGPKARYFQEWMAELDEYERQGIGTLGPAVRIFLTSPATRRGLRSSALPTLASFRSVGDCLFSFNDTEAAWRGWQINQERVLTRQYRDGRFDTRASRRSGF
jgi:hypothetical protein